MFKVLSEHMGELLGPKPVAEIVITQYADDRINYQVEGMGAPVHPEHACKMLNLVYNEMFTQIPKESKETPA